MFQKFYIMFYFQLFTFYYTKIVPKVSKMKIILINFPLKNIGYDGDYTLGFYSYLDLIPISQLKYVNQIIY